MTSFQCLPVPHVKPSSVGEGMLAAGSLAAGEYPCHTVRAGQLSGLNVQYVEKAASAHVLWLELPSV